MDQLTDLKNKTVIVTGGANGIGLEVVRQCHGHGAHVVIADMASAREAAENAIKDLGSEPRAIYVPANVTSWEDMSNLFQTTLQQFGSVDYVIANAGIMENQRFFDFTTDDSGNLQEDPGTGMVINVNLKGAMNTLRLAVFHMQKNQPDQNGHRGSVVLVSSTSGYIGGTEVVSYVSSKHGVIGLLRSSHAEAARRGVRVNAVAPFITPTAMTGGYSEAWVAEGLPANSASGVASAITKMAADESCHGQCHLVVGDECREVEASYKSHLGSWVGKDVAEIFGMAGAFFRRLGGYPLPIPRRSE